MSIPTEMSLSGFIATAPQLDFGESGRARFHVRAGIEQWRTEPDGRFTRLDPAFLRPGPVRLAGGAGLRPVPGR